MRKININFNLNKTIFLFSLFLFVLSTFISCKTKAEIALENAIKNKSIVEAIQVLKDFPNEKNIEKKVDDAIKTIKKKIDNSEYEILVDNQDSNKYKTILMRDGNVWMAENLKYYNESMKWSSWCPDKNCEEYGRLYTWENAKKVCPKGWHLPSDDEWWHMLQYYGGADQAFLIRAAKQKNSTNGKKAYWALYKNLKFKVQLSGKVYVYTHDLDFDSVRKNGFYWTSSKGEDNVILYYEFEGGQERVIRRTVKKRYKKGFSCRCIKNK